MHVKKIKSINPFLKLVLVGYISCLTLYAYSYYLDRSLIYDYLIYNLFLASLPLLIAWLIVHLLKKYLWSNWRLLILSVLYLLFLPNSFYMVTDLIHVQNMPINNIVFNVLTFYGFIIMAFFLGIVSLVLIHKELRRRLYPNSLRLFLLVIIILNSLAIYIGRNLRWNSWDIIIHPNLILVDVWSLTLNISSHQGLVDDLIGFSLLIGAIYFLAWRTYRLAWRSGVDDMADHIKTTKKYNK